MTSPEVPQQQPTLVGLADESFLKLTLGYASLHHGFSAQMREIEAMRAEAEQREAQFQEIVRAGAAQVAELQAEIAELQAEIAELKARILELEADGPTVLTLCPADVSA